MRRLRVPSNMPRPFFLVLLLVVQFVYLAAFTVPAQALNPTFGGVINVSSDLGASGNPVMAAVGNRVYLAWLNNTSGIQNVLFSASINNGASFGTVKNITRVTNQDSANLQIAAAGSSVYLVWDQNVTSTERDIFFSASINNGTIFGNPVNLCSSSSCGGITKVINSVVPRVAASGNNVTVVWFTTTTSQHQYNILAKTSTSRGSDLGTVSTITISQTALPNTDTLAPPRIAETGKYVYAVWTEASPTATYFKASSTGGTSFGNPLSLTTLGSGETDTYPQVIASGNNVYAAWTNDTMNTDNTMFAASINNGTTFTPSMNLNKAPITDLHPQIAASGNNVYVVWYDNAAGGQILYRVSNNKGSNFLPFATLTTNTTGSDQQTIVAQGGNVYAAWAANSPADSVFFATNNTVTTFGAPQNLTPMPGNNLLPNPVIATSGTSVYVVWQDDTMGNGDILFRGTITQHTTTTTIGCSPSTVAIGQGTTCTATVTDTSAGATTPTGTVSFTSTIGTSTFTPSASCSLAGSTASASCSVTYTQTSSTTTPTITGSYLGDTAHVASSGTTTITVTLRSSSTSVSCSPSTFPVGTPTTCGATVTDSSPGTPTTPTGSVGFTSSGPGTFSPLSCALTSGSCSVIFTPTSTGSHTITGSYGGDSKHSTSSGTFLLTVTTPADVAVTVISTTKYYSYNSISSKPVLVNVTATNLGTTAQTFIVSAKANDTLANVNVFIDNNQTVTSLPPGGSTTLTFNWTGGWNLALGNYSISAYASRVPGETNLSNNFMICPSSACSGWNGPFKSKLKGDVSGDCKVDIVDLTRVASAYGKSGGQGGYSAAADLNNDGIINLQDLVLVASNYSAQVSPCPY